MGSLLSVTVCLGLVRSEPVLEPRVWRHMLPKDSRSFSWTVPLSPPGSQHTNLTMSKAYPSSSSVPSSRRPPWSPAE